jgi:penicillin-binding protein 1A
LYSIFTQKAIIDGTATYFREYLRDYMKNWVKENKKPDGDEYDIYSDGLKIYTTIDSKMPRICRRSRKGPYEKSYKKNFGHQQKGNKNAPFVNITDAETDKIIKQAMKSSDRWRILKDKDMSDEEIIKSFSVKTKMTVFHLEWRKRYYNDSARLYTLL